MSELTFGHLIKENKMKTLKSKQALENAIALEQITAARRDLEKKEKALKEWFLASLADENAAKVGDILIVITDCENTSIDRVSLASDHGNDFLKAYTKVTKYRKVEVKKA